MSNGKANTIMRKDGIFIDIDWAEKTYFSIRFNYNVVGSAQLK